ncbi:glycosyltransferase family 2 protein [Pedobacter sp. Du54]|uniref:glycosyltransferase family 2 protein n=1 Tax=Pedobacter anseongensis TaxID=3133439 RepID=UPI0030A008C7
MNKDINKKEVFILIPTYNEGKVIVSTIEPLIKMGYTVVVIDDCSIDNTEEILKDLPIIYLKHFINLGQGAALQTGITYSLAKNAKYAITFDADGQHNYEEIPSLLTPILEGKVDITLGTRFKRKEDVAQIPKFRKLVLKVAILVNGIFTGLWLTDAHNGFRAMNAAAIASIKLKENRMAHASEILSQIKQNNLRYDEIPVNVVYTDYSKTKGQSSMNSFNILIDILLKNIF